MHARPFVVALAALPPLACRPGQTASEPVGASYLSSATAPSGTSRPSSIETAATRDDRRICGYAQLPAIPFDRNSTLVTPDEDVLLERLADCFRTPEMQLATIVLIGRAAEPARHDCSAELALQRSERVKKFLVGHGLSAERVIAVSAGDRQTPTTIATPRVDVVVAFPKSVAHSAQ